MQCPLCQSSSSAVLETRQNRQGNRRRRKCLDCEYIYATIEVVVKKEKKDAKKNRLGEQSAALPPASIWGRVHSDN